MKLVHEFEELALERRAFGRLSPDSFRAGAMSATEALGQNRKSLSILIEQISVAKSTLCVT